MKNKKKFYAQQRKMTDTNTVRMRGIRNSVFVTYKPLYDSLEELKE